MNYYRKVFRLQAQDSPNVRLAIGLMECGRARPDANLIRTDARPWGIWTAQQYLDLIRLWENSGKPAKHLPEATPGVLSWADYLHRRATLDPNRQCVVLDADFYEGPELFLFPQAWLDAAANLDRQLAGRPRQARAMGVDTAEGGDSTVWTIGDELGVLEMVSMKTPNTNVIPGQTIALGLKWQVPPDCWVFDRGGGGYEHVCTLKGLEVDSRYPYRHVRSVGFGEQIVAEPRHGDASVMTRKAMKEEHYAYFNRRAQLYGEASLLLDPRESGELPPAIRDLRPEGVRGYALPSNLKELRRQLGVFRKTYDAEGRLKLPPKNATAVNSQVETLVKLLGCSPDEADSFVLMIHGMLHKKKVFIAG